jgi:glycosyltransferase involved in cell wall biosynthesis
MRIDSSNGRPRLLFVVNADWFFTSHRLPLAKACIAAGFDVGLCAGGGDPNARLEIERAGIRFEPMPIERGGTRPHQELRTLAALVRVYRKFRPDLVHHVTIKPVIYGSLVARALGARGIVNAVTGLGYAFIPRAEDGLPHRALRRSLWLAYRAALDGARTRVIFQNEDDRGTFVDRRLVAHERSVIVRGSGVDFSLFAPTPLPEGPFVALMPARLLLDKGVAEFVAAASLLKRRWPDARFVLLGRIDPGNPAAIGRDQVESWVGQGLVEWWGHCEHREMPPVLAKAHVVVLPSYREGLPLALAEAAAAGRACITTDVAGCRDTVVHGETGWLVPARDSNALARALEAALGDRAETERRGRKAAVFARERFGIESVISSTLAVYRDLLDNLPQRRIGVGR